MHLLRTSLASTACLILVCAFLRISPATHAASSFTVSLPVVIKAGGGKTIYVAKSPNASANKACGSSSNPCANINDATDQAQAGDTVLVASGLYEEGISIDVADGTADKPITLKSAGTVTIKPPRAQNVININKSYWIIEGFEITPGGVEASAVSFGSGATHSVLRGNYIHDGQNHGVTLGDGSSDNQILDNTIANFRHPDNIDAHGVAVKESDGNLIKGNRIFNNSGDGVQVFTIDTPEISLSGRSADNTQIIDNTIYDNDENAVDVKSSKNTVISGNLMWGYKPALETDNSNYRSDGMAIAIHYWARDVIVASNIITNSTWGIEVSRGEKGGVRFANLPTNVSIHNNYIAGMTMPLPPYPPSFDEENKGNGAGIVIRESDKVSVLNNTIVTTEGFCLAVTWSSTTKTPPAGPPTGLRILNNSLSDCKRGEMSIRSDLPLANVESDYNHYGSLVGGRLFWSSKEFTLVAWQAAQRLDLHSLTTTGSGILPSRILPESTLVDKGKDVGLPFCGTAPDIGAFEANCN